MRRKAPIIHYKTMIYAGAGPFFGAPGTLFGAPKNLFGAPKNLFGYPKNLFGYPKNLFGYPGNLFGAPKNRFSCRALLVYKKYRRFRASLREFGGLFYQRFMSCGS
jgi:hypothetical protein